MGIKQSIKTVKKNPNCLPWKQSLN